MFICLFVLYASGSYNSKRRQTFHGTSLGPRVRVRANIFPKSMCPSLPETSPLFQVNDIGAFVGRGEVPNRTQ